MKTGKAARKEAVLNELRAISRRSRDVGYEDIKAHKDALWPDTWHAVMRGIAVALDLDDLATMRLQDITNTMLGKTKKGAAPGQLRRVVEASEQFTAASPKGAHVGVCEKMLDGLFEALGLLPQQAQYARENAVRAVPAEPQPATEIVVVLREVSAAAEQFMRVWRVHERLGCVQRVLRRAIFLRRMEVVFRGFNRQRSEAFRDLLRAERAHVAKLEAIVRGYYEPLHAPSTKEDRGLVSEAELSAVFGCAPRLLELHRTILGRFEEVSSGGWPMLRGVADVVVEHAGGLQAHAIYARNVAWAQKTLAGLVASRKGFCLFLERRRSSGYQGVDLSDMLAAPLNHVTYYGKALRLMLKHTGLDHDDHGPLERAVKVMDPVVEAVSQAIQQAHERCGVMEAVVRLGGFTGAFVDVERREVVAEGDAAVGYARKTKQRHYVMFTDVLVIGRKMKGGHAPVRDVIPMSKISIVISSTTATSEMSQSLSSSLSSSSSSTSIEADGGGGGGSKQMELQIEGEKPQTLMVKLNSEEERAKVQAQIQARGRGIVRRHASVPAGAVFGVDLTDLVAAEGRTGSGIPIIVERTCAHLTTFLDVEGLFRLSGSASRVAGLRRLVESGVAGWQFRAEDDALSIAAMFKGWLRELPDPLMTHGLYRDFVRAAQEGPLDFVMSRVTPVLKRLPRAHLQTLVFLVDFLAKVVAHSAHNKMDGKNVAIVFAPNLFRTRQDTAETFVEMQHLFSLTAELIANHSQVHQCLETC
jgi:hypothetical protein